MAKRPKGGLRVALSPRELRAGDVIPTSMATSGEFGPRVQGRQGSGLRGNGAARGQPDRDATGPKAGA
jgi:hypothetical protein